MQISCRRLIYNDLEDADKLRYKSNRLSIIFKRREERKGEW